MGTCSAFKKYAHAVAWTLCIFICVNKVTLAAETTTEIPTDMAPATSDDKKPRNFYQVLEDLLADFEYDLKNGNVRGLKDLSIRDIATSENIPKSFKTHLELLVTERILKETKTNMIQCVPCRSKRATLSGDNVIVSSPDANPSEMSRFSKMYGIQGFLDIAFAYQPNGMLLSLHVTDAESGSVIWSRTYNSETSRASAFRRGVDYSQIEQARESAEYEPTLLYKPTVYYLFERTTTSYQGVLGLGFRLVERYDNRKKEVGFEANYLLDSSTLVGAADTSSGNIYTGFNLTLLFVHAWNLIGDIENYNEMRGSIFAAIGGTYASGFLGGLIRAGYEWRLGKHWAFSGNLGYRPSATAFLSGTSVGTISGFEFGIGIGALF